MGFRAFLISNGLILAFRAVNRSGKIKEVAESLDKLLDKEFKGKSEAIQESFVESVLLELAKELLIERPERYKEILSEFARGIQEKKS